MTFTVIEYRGEVEHGQAEVANASEFGKFIMRRVKELGLTFDEETQTYQTPEGLPVSFTFARESGVNFLRAVLTPKEVENV